ncbi:unnamed protein product, partial [Didymodactylos carnosus]
SLAITTNKTQSLLKISIDELMDQHVRKKLDEISAEVDNIIVGQQGYDLTRIYSYFIHNSYI